MKLFDRSVDFAQFNEDPPLYALARAWMQNKPYGIKSSDSQEGNQDGDSPPSSQESGTSSAAHSVSIKKCVTYSRMLPLLIHATLVCDSVFVNFGDLNGMSFDNNPVCSIYA